jgi:hypothetical protein
MNDKSAVAGVTQSGNQSIVVNLPNGRSFEMSFEQLLAHTMGLQIKLARRVQRAQDDLRR